MRLRLRFVAALLAVVVSGAAFVTVQRRSASADEAEERAKLERGAAADANQALLDSLPPLDGVRFLSYQEVDGPPGGAGTMWHIAYTAESIAVAEAAVSRHADALASWGEVRREPSSVAARDGRRWVRVEAGPVGEDRRPGVLVALDALDGEALPAP